MKSPLEIPVYSIHRGPVREVVALGLHDSFPGLDYLRELQRSNPKGLRILDGQFRFICESPQLAVRDNFKLLDAFRHIYEFRTRSGLRLYCFLEMRKLVILTNGGKKNTLKEQTQDIRRAQQLHDEFLDLKPRGASLVIIES